MITQSSQYLLNERKAFSLYTLHSRAIPYAADGLKAAARRVLWIARNGNKYKSATLAGATMPIHPHGAPESTINTLAGPYGNNICLLDGEGAFGTLLNPTAYGASRYTSVKISSFTKDVIFRDIELIPLIDNYDGTLKQPKHFIPLIPIVLLNPQEGIAVGFACNILPRTINNIINAQIDYLKLRPSLSEYSYPAFIPTNNKCEQCEIEDDIKKWVFFGDFTRKGTTGINITKLPYGLTYKKLISKLHTLQERSIVRNIEDNSKDYYNIIVTFKRGYLDTKSNNEILILLGLITKIKENLNVVDFNNHKIISLTFDQLIKSFTDWRLQWYIKRYQRLKQLLQKDIEKYTDTLIAIKNNVGSKAIKIKGKIALNQYLKTIKIKHIDYIAELPIYKLTITEKQIIQRKLTKAEQTLIQYQQLIDSPAKRTQLYISELTEIKKQYG